MLKQHEPSLVFTIRFPASFVEEEVGRVVALCAPLDVMSQGATRQEAKRHLVEAVELFVASCFDRGTLDRVLKKCGGKVRREAPTKPHWLVIDVPLPLVAQQHVESRTN
jgi:predicted RNase H-like HicB family nuclease